MHILIKCGKIIIDLCCVFIFIIVLFLRLNLTSMQSRKVLIYLDNNLGEKNKTAVKTMRLYFKFECFEFECIKVTSLYPC